MTLSGNSVPMMMMKRFLLHVENFLISLFGVLLHRKFVASFEALYETILKTEWTLEFLFIRFVHRRYTFEYSSFFCV